MLAYIKSDQENNFIIAHRGIIQHLSFSMNVKNIRPTAYFKANYLPNHQPHIAHIVHANSRIKSALCECVCFNIFIKINQFILDAEGVRF